MPNFKGGLFYFCLYLSLCSYSPGASSISRNGSATAISIENKMQKAYLSQSYFHTFNLNYWVSFTNYVPEINIFTNKLWSSYFPIKIKSKFLQILYMKTHMQTSRINLITCSKHHKVVLMKDIVNMLQSNVDLILFPSA